MKALVTGGAGYIGSVSVRYLADAGHEVVVLDSLERGHAEAVDPRARLVVGDVGDGSALDDALEGVDAVLHCAGYIEVAESVALPERYMDNNAVRPARMLDEMASRGVDAIVFSSTAAVYGEPASVPIPEDAATAPVNAYGLSKLRFEQELLRREDSDGLRAVRFRYFNVAGAWPDGSIGEAHEPETHLIPRVLRAILAGEDSFEVYGNDYDTPDGTCVRDFVHVMDLAQAHCLALERVAGGGAGGVFNLGSERGYTNLEVLRVCEGVARVNLKLRFGLRRPGDPARLVASSENARSELGWKPTRGDLQTMIEDAWAWHSAHPAGYREAPQA